ncbi:non-ribosomal peptide synthetase [Streptomyces sp. ML-6]|uniref:non-ribosomal peptide synthetase n=1 Tax=Streptomyces sp. ML-6 TaxID=2982693 RepID=UPI0024C05939|nr:non-ribosomal peptide synthetase [Streptomyces sp. ML-6]MDK0524154.1 non-ribosomal peptide synthetase [Streptomyces sp. ML-6]
MHHASTITAAFARQVAARPDAVAVSAPDATLSYAELDARAGLLAGHLRELGVVPESRVAVDLPRSADLVVTLLAVLKAGGCYLALDPQQPEERRALVLKDAGAQLVVTPELLAAATAAPDPAPLPGSGPQSTAYLAYTSGSTGAPKGVCVPHRAVIRLVREQELLPIRPDDVFLLLAPVAFDASTLELWGPLLNGARLVVAPPEDPSPAGIEDLVRREGVTTLWLTAGLFHSVVTAHRLRGMRGLRHLIAGGDVLSTAHVERALRELPDIRLVNGYGPTENTTFTTCHVVTGAVGEGPVPIGVPLTGSTVHLLDEHLLPVPEGRPGELYTGGSGLAHGYQGDPALTAARFLPDPFATTPGGRLHRTGDLARRRPDGALEFLGRTDLQLKIRGFRVEPNEIEAALRTHPEIDDAAVVAQRPHGERILAAFYVTERTLTTAELRTHLAALVPRYMIPAVYLRVDELPLNRNGKTDRAQLAATTMPGRPELSTDYRAPADEHERWLAELWADLLQIDEVGVDDDFFELGGHSLMATRITVEIDERYGRTVAPVAFYEHPTVAELAEMLAAGEDHR